MKSSNPTHRAANKPPAQAVQYVKTVQVVAQEIVEEVGAALDQFREIAAELGANNTLR
jgi:hypothetical protein